MANAIRIKPQTIREILTILRRLEKEIAEVKQTLNIAPPYGSKEWWEWSDKRALKDVKEGRYESYASVEEYVAELKKRR